MIKATIVADSIAPSGFRITTFSLVFPRFILPEFLTHRQFSRNASSSRAIPTAKIVASVYKDPAEPVYWGRNQQGMQASEELDGIDLRAAQALWREAGRAAGKYTQQLADIGLHKQVANRASEPWHHMSVVCTSTNYENFFALRCHHDAQPEMQALAWSMADEYYAREPLPVDDGLWHLPYITSEEMFEDEITQIKCSVARCARVSYKNHDGTDPSVESDLKLYERLVRSDREEWEPGHMSPTEHQAQAQKNDVVSGNFRGWVQYRKTLAMECMSFDYERARKERGF